MTARAADDLPDDELFANVVAIGSAAAIASAPETPPVVQQAAEDAAAGIADKLK